MFNLFKKILKFNFIFLHFYIINSEIGICNYLNKNLMQIWTNIDLIRAIYSTQEQRQEFAQNIFLDLLALNKNINLNLIYKEEKKQIKKVKKLLRKVINSFNEVFNNLDIKESILISFILNKMLLNLKYPIYIDPKVTSNHTSIEYTLSRNAVIIKDRYKRV